jgi:hypothetical protein
LIDDLKLDLELYFEIIVVLELVLEEEGILEEIET